MDQPFTPNDILSALRQSLNQMAQWGCKGFACSAAALATLERWGQAPSHKPEGSSRATVGGGTGSAAALETLDAIRNDLGECRRCGLHQHRTQIVFGEGNPKAQIIFIGHGPGVEEDHSGRPFVDGAGQLLDRIIEAMKLRRDQVYLCNIVKCCPKSELSPQAEEIKACRGFLTRQIVAIQPKVICTLGTCATQTLLDTTEPLAELHGRFHDQDGIKIMPTFHPADLLRQPELKRAVWEDMKKVMAFLRISL
ncbi:MAG: uracil-DNA glycosylase [Desulfobacteraceae bacterium]|nr:uracil-DNA glycosylase [Desulfobacteraceae bacterium]